MIALNGVWSDISILQTIIEESQKLINILQRDLVLKTKFPVKIREIHKIDKKNSIHISAFGYENKKNKH